MIQRTSHSSVLTATVVIAVILLPFRILQGETQFAILAALVGLLAIIRMFSFPQKGSARRDTLRVGLFVVLVISVLVSDARITLEVLPVEIFLFIVLLAHGVYRYIQQPRAADN